MMNFFKTSKMLHNRQPIHNFCNLCIMLMLVCADSFWKIGLEGQTSNKNVSFNLWIQFVQSKIAEWLYWGYFGLTVQI